MGRACGDAFLQPLVGILAGVLHTLTPVGDADDSALPRFGHHDHRSGRGRDRPALRSSRWRGHCLGDPQPRASLRPAASDRRGGARQREGGLRSRSRDVGTPGGRGGSSDRPHHRSHPRRVRPHGRPQHRARPVQGSLPGGRPDRAPARAERTGARARRRVDGRSGARRRRARRRSRARRGSLRLRRCGPSAGAGAPRRGRSGDRHGLVGAHGTRSTRRGGGGVHRGAERGDRGADQEAERPDGASARPSRRGVDRRRSPVVRDQVRRRYPGGGRGRCHRLQGVGLRVPPQPCRRARTTVSRRVGPDHRERRETRVPAASGWAIAIPGCGSRCRPESFP